MILRTLAIAAASSLIFAGCAPSGKASTTEQNSATAAPPAETPLGGDDGQAPAPVSTAPAAPMPARVDPFPEDARKFSSPWSRTDTVIVIDAYAGNGIDWAKMASDKRVVGVLHRSSIGLTVDSQYAARQKVARQRGYLWGAYHLGKSGDPIAQAKLFLKTVGDAKDVLMALDLEDTSNSGMMNVANAKIFLDYVYAQTGKMPIVYANQSVTAAISAAMKRDETFAKTRLWYARFRKDIPDFPAALWPTYFLWQFSSEINCSSTGSCLYNVPGTSYDMDINVFYGSKAALEYEWYQ